MSDTYDVTLRFECHEPALAAAIMHEIIMVLNPEPDGSALVQNPRIWSVEAIGGANGEIIIRDSRDFDLAFQRAGTALRDRAYHFVHSACRSGALTSVACSTLRR